MRGQKRGGSARGEGGGCHGQGCCRGDVLDASCRKSRLRSHIITRGRQALGPLATLSFTNGAWPPFPAHPCCLAVASTRTTLTLPS